ncbi:maleylpyruvate isomerase family mycothiol-dependent enzyme [Streptomyces sp. NPDC001941]|uniref:maleylpyruvate isomerase family mycothiol-dependent enzyme n=1 Tax=Streptomyces sp. NPDC001941 TaxID=3154659 RepID=UPI0033269FF3
MDYVDRFVREVRAFEAAARRVGNAPDVPLVPSCPGWTVNDLVLHLGQVHRFVIRVVEDRLTGAADTSTPAFLRLPDDVAGWPHPDDAPNHGPMPAGLIDWFSDGAARLAELLRTRDPAEEVWSWAPDRTVGFWRRIQSVEAAVHRWDAQDVVGRPEPLDAEFAADVVTHTFTVMAPFRRARAGAPPGAGERFGFRRTDGDGAWAVSFDGDRVRLEEGAGDRELAACEVEFAGSASDLALFLWRRVPVERVLARGGAKEAERYFALVPPV